MVELECRGREGTNFTLSRRLLEALTAGAWRLALMLALTAALLLEMLLLRLASICALRSTAAADAFVSHGIARPGVVLGAMDERLGVGTPREARPAEEEGARDERCLTVGAGAMDDLRDEGAASDLRDLPTRFFLACLRISIKVECLVSRPISPCMVQCLVHRTDISMSPRGSSACSYFRRCHGMKRWKEGKVE